MGGGVENINFVEWKGKKERGLIRKRPKSNRHTLIIPCGHQSPIY